MSEDWDYNTWTTADLQSLLEEIKGVLEEREENDMNKSYANMNREELIDEVMDVTKCTITYWEDWTALEKLLAFVPTERLKEFLPEEESYDDTPDWSGKGASPMMEQEVIDAHLDEEFKGYFGHTIPMLDTPDFDLGDVQENEDETIHN